MMVSCPACGQGPLSAFGPTYKRKRIFRPVAYWKCGYCKFRWTA